MGEDIRNQRFRNDGDTGRDSIDSNFVLRIVNYGSSFSLKIDTHSNIESIDSEYNDSKQDSAAEQEIGKRG